MEPTRRLRSGRIHSDPNDWIGSPYDEPDADEPPATPEPAPAPKMKAPQPEPAPAGPGGYTPGAILWINRQILGIYKTAVPEKGYHMLLVLGPGGVIMPKGLPLDLVDVQELGHLPPKWFESLQSAMRWKRDMIVFHCYRYEDAEKVPLLDGPPEPVRPATPPAAHPHTAPATPPEPPPAPLASHPEKPLVPEGLRRGQRLEFLHGSRKWQAVYWGKDDEGDVIVHKTFEDWALMHFNLSAYPHRVHVEPEPDPALVREIERSLCRRQG